MYFFCKIFSFIQCFIPFFFQKGRCFFTFVCECFHGGTIMWFIMDFTWGMNLYVCGYLTFFSFIASLSRKRSETWKKHFRSYGFVLLRCIVTWEIILLCEFLFIRMHTNTCGLYPISSYVLDHFYKLELFQYFFCDTML